MKTLLPLLALLFLTGCPDLFDHRKYQKPEPFKLGSDSTTLVPESIMTREEFIRNGTLTNVPIIYHVKESNVKPNEAAFPHKTDNQFDGPTEQLGLTKREYFAGKAFAALMHPEYSMDPKEVAVSAVEYADALLEELERTK